MMEMLNVSYSEKFFTSDLLLLLTYMITMLPGVDRLKVLQAQSFHMHSPEEYRPLDRMVMGQCLH